MLDYLDGETLDARVTDFDDEKLAVLRTVVRVSQTCKYL